MKNARRTWLSIHLTLGLSIGALLVLLGLTGSILVFYLEIDQIINPQIEPTTVPYEMPAQQDILDALQQAHPRRTDPWRIEQPMHDDWPIMARYYTPVESVGKNFAPLMLTVDPVTLEVTSSRLWGDYAMTWIYDLHYSLLLEKRHWHYRADFFNFVYFRHLAVVAGLGWFETGIKTAASLRESPAQLRSACAVW